MSPALLSLIAFTGAAAMLTITPGLDTALVLRTAATNGPRQAALAGVGIATGCLVWAVLVALGVGAVLEASVLAYDAMRWLGAAYLIFVGVRMLRQPRDRISADVGWRISDGRQAFLRGALTNLLNPKVGIFYVSFLPQFVPTGFSPAPFLLLLGVIHTLLGLLWFAALIVFTYRVGPFLKRDGVLRALDRLTGSMFVVFGVSLAVRSRRV